MQNIIMIDLYTWPTPNGRKISILLEEMNIPYNIVAININQNKQFTKKFSLISPSHKIPAIFDHDKNISIFESGAILFYLSKKYNKFIPQKYYWQTIEWLMFQISQVGPMLGQTHQFLYYNKGKSNFAENKYRDYSKRIYETLDNQLSNKNFLAEEYSIADIATWPWIARYEIQQININNYPNVLKWFKEIATRPAVIKGYNIIGEFQKIPLS